jgi:hypothetical protein
MRILLDECVPWPMRELLANHACTTPQKRGWGGIKNGDLLRLAEGEFDLFITSDQNIRYQQNLAGGSIPILELSTNDLRRIQAAAANVDIRLFAYAGGRSTRQVTDVLHACTAHRICGHG